MIFRDSVAAIYGSREIVSRDVPVFPLWDQSNIVIAKKNVQNIQVNASGDWGFVRNLSRE